MRSPYTYELTTSHSSPYPTIDGLATYGRGDDMFTGDDGDDLFIGFGGDDAFVGGGGEDMAAFSLRCVSGAIQVDA